MMIVEEMSPAIPTYIMMTYLKKLGAKEKHVLLFGRNKIVSGNKYLTLRI